MGLLVYPWISTVSGVLLVWIGIKLIAQDDAAEKRVKASDRLLTAVSTLIVADLVMSLDNVVTVAAAAKGSLMLLILGLIISIPIVIVGSQIIMKLIEDRKSTRLNSSHPSISYAVFCLKKKKVYDI